MGLLDSLSLPGDLKKLSSDDLEKLASEVRDKIIDVASGVGGHLSSSLGSVELGVALHTVFDSPRDKIVWDVGHQAYSHKLLTGRSGRFDTLRKAGGLSGFPSRKESPHDVFTVGHASTSISQALGIARARDSEGADYSVVAVVGDGALSGGLALEGINNVLNLHSNLIVILNDNEMSISQPVGSISNYLTKVRTSDLYAGTKDRIEALIARIPRIGKPMVKSVEDFKNRVKHFFVDFKVGVIFEELGFKYLGPIDGHNIPILMSTLHFAKDFKGPVLIHILTEKGRGYRPAESSPTKFHGTPPFNVETGEQRAGSAKSFTSVFGSSLARLAEKNDRVIAITAAMVDGTGLKEFADRFPSRFYDVGIAEGHAVSFASGLASQGFRPVVAVYSTFLQRAYDQIIHDVCLNELPVVFAVDRAGLVGRDGPTHHGVFDMAFLRTLPNMTLMAPSDAGELEEMLSLALRSDLPSAIRYPRGGAAGPGGETAKVEPGKGVVAFNGQVNAAKSKVLIVSIGSMVYPSVDAARELEGGGIAATVINARFVKPIDSGLIMKCAAEADLVVTVEEGSLEGGFGSAVLELGIDIPVLRLGIPDKFVAHGERSELLKSLGLDSAGIARSVRGELKK